MGEEQGIAQVTRTGWPLVGGLLMGLWLLMPMLLATAGTKSDPKPASSAAELSTIRGVVKATTSHLSQPGPGPDQPAALQGGTAV